MKFKKSILVTGASGFIGSWICKALVREMPEALILGVGRHAPFPKENLGDQFESIVCDLLNPEEIKRAFPSQIHAIIHLAADPRTFLPSAEATQQFVHNSLMAAYLANYAVAAKAALFVQASSVYLYSGCSHNPFREDDLALPSESLGASKIAIEAFLKSKALSGDFRAISLRMFTVYGPGSRRHQFIPQAIQKLQSPDRIAQFGMGSVKRDFVYIEDIAAAFLAALKAPLQTEPYLALNIGSGVQTSIREVISLLAELLGVDKEIRYADSLASSSNRDHLADVSRAEKILNWNPSTSLKVGLIQTIRSGQVVS